MNTKAEQSGAIDLDKNSTVEEFAVYINDSEGLVNDEFVATAKELVEIIDRERDEQGKAPFSSSQKMIFLQEMYRSALKYKDKWRKDGSSVFYSHIVGAMRVQLENHGLTGLASLLAVMKHDEVEDFFDFERVEKVAEDVAAICRIALDVYDQYFTGQLPEGFSIARAKTACFVVLTNDLPQELRATFAKYDQKLVFALLEGVHEKSKSSEKITGSLQKRFKRSEKELAEGELLEDLIDFDAYKHLLGDFDEMMARDIKKEVVERVRSMTKSRKEDYDKTMQATFEKQLRVLSHTPKAGPDKIADRVHNMKTLDAHDEEKRLEIARETDQIYLPLANILGLRRSVRDLVYDTVRMVNPKLLEEFEHQAASRKRARSTTHKRKAIIDVLRHPDIVDVNIVDRSLDYYTSRVPKPLEETTFDNLEIGRLDPMFEIVVTTRFNSDQDERWGKMGEVKSFIESQFASGFGCRSKAFVPDENDPQRFDGVGLTVFNKKFGGRLVFRINDEKAEARRKRGVFAEGGEAPKSFKPMIQAILDRTVARVSGVSARSGSIDAAHQEFLRPRISVFTRDGEERILPDGATVLDFVGSIHGGALVGLQSAVVSSDLLSEDMEKPIGIFDKLENGRLYIFESCLGGKGDNPKKVKADPGWVLFCQTFTASHLKRYFNSEGEGKLYERGQKYLERMTEIYNIDFDFLVNLLVQRYPNREPEEIVKDVGSSDINPVVVMADYVLMRQRQFCARDRADFESSVSGSWDVWFEMSEYAGSLHDFTEDFTAKTGLKIEHFKEHVKGSGKVNLIIDPDAPDMDIYSFFKILLKLSYKYKVRLTMPLESVFGKTHRGEVTIPGAPDRI